MKLSIVNGVWILQSMDGVVRLSVLPRRALDAAATQVTLIAEPMPALVFHPEQHLGETPMEAWVWDGSPEAARRIAPHIMSAVHARLSPPAASTRAQAWRRTVLGSLFPGSTGKAAFGAPLQAKV